MTLFMLILAVLIGFILALVLVSIWYIVRLINQKNEEFKVELVKLQTLNQSLVVGFEEQAKLKTDINDIKMFINVSQRRK